MNNENRPTGGFPDGLRVSIETEMRKNEELLDAARRANKTDEIVRLTQIIQQQKRALASISMHTDAAENKAE